MRPKAKYVTWRSVTPIVLLVGALTVLAAIWYFLDEPVDLPSPTVKEMLSGNTVDGLWGEDNAPYRQYFAADGATLRVEQGSAPREGSWRVAEDGAACFAWGEGEEGCYRVRPKDDFFLWVDAARSLGYPFRLLEGKQLAPTGDQQGS